MSRVPPRSLSSLVVAALLAACGGPAYNAQGAAVGVGDPCGFEVGCGPGLICDPTTFTCQACDPLVACDNRCVDPATFQSDDHNCGSCDHWCFGGTSCVAGTCECPAGTTTCPDTPCIDLDADHDHCGSCDHACDADQSCVAGQCASSVILAGDSTLEPDLDSSDAGWAEAYRYVAGASGSAQVLRVYVDPSSDAIEIDVGLYDDAGGHPGTLLTAGTIGAPVVGWNSVAVTAASVTEGQPYWIAVLSPLGDGAIAFRDSIGGSEAGHCALSESSAETQLTELPAQWSPGPAWTTVSMSAYATR